MTKEGYVQKSEYTTTNRWESAYKEGMGSERANKKGGRQTIWNVSMVGKVEGITDETRSLA